MKENGKEERRSLMSDREIGRKQRGDEGQKVNWEGRPSIKPVNSLSDRHGSDDSLFCQSRWPSHKRGEAPLPRTGLRMATLGWGGYASVPR
jgi:hypothetical protein